MPFFPRSSGHLPEPLDASLARLGRTSVDLYQIHYPVPFASIRRLMDRLADAVEAGKVRAIVDTFRTLLLAPGPAVQAVLDELVPAP